MSWTACQIIFRLLTPMHIGAAKLGNLQHTRSYVTGATLWGALTARLTRDAPALGGDYHAVGHRVNDELAFSYFYPTTGSTDGKVDQWPWDDPDGFGWRYLGSHTGTALGYDRNAATAGSLHETEFIAPVTRDGKPVHLVGYIFERSDCALPWRTVLSRLQLGGERTYGWGRVELLQAAPHADKLSFPGKWQLTGARPEVQLSAQERLLAHVHAPPGLVGIQGSVVPLVGRRTDDAANHGRKLKAQICREPGAFVTQTQWFEIQECGIWSARRLNNE